MTDLLLALFGFYTYSLCYQLNEIRKAIKEHTVIVKQYVSTYTEDQK